MAYEHLFNHPWTLDNDDDESFKRGDRLRILDAFDCEVAELTPFEDEWTIGEVLRARTLLAAPEMYVALKSMRLMCTADALNPCWDNRPSDKPGLHWGSTPENQIAACPSCQARAALAKAEGRR